MFKLLPAVLCLPLLVAAREDFSAWKDSTRIFINTGTTGANIAEAVNDFPLLVRLDSASLTWSEVRANGVDLRFADPDGTLLRHEVELFDAPARKAAIWVQVPRVDPMSQTDHIVMYWNNPAAASISDGGAVFDTARGHAAVWHFAEDRDGIGIRDVFRDATRNANHGDDYASDGIGAGVIGKGMQFDGIDDRVQVDNSPSVALAGPLTLSAWVKPDRLTAGNSTSDVILRKGDANPNSYQLGIYNQKAFCSLDGPDDGGLQSKATIATGRYYHIAATWEGRTVRLYINGLLDNEGDTPIQSGVLTKDARPLYIGGRVISMYDMATLDRWDGDIDEARISRVAHPPQYIKLSYENQKAGSTLLTFSAFPKVAAPTDDLSHWSRKRKLTLNTTDRGAAVPGPVDDFPMLVRLDTGIFDFAEALSGGQDIRFSDPDGTLLPHALERWDARAGKAEVWVKVPRVEGGSGTDHVFMHWGNPLAIPRNAPAAVFDTADGFRGAWHLGDGSSPENPLGGFLDATSLRHNGQDLVARDGSEAVIGKGVEFRSTADRIRVPSTDALGFTDSLTLSAWINGSAWYSSTKQVNPIIRKGDDTPVPYQLAVDSGHLSLHLNETDEAGHHGRTELKTGRWHHVAATWGGGQVRLFVDGRMDLDAPISLAAAIPKDTRPLYIGGRDTIGGGSPDQFLGFIDEVQISSRPRNPDWIKLSYESQKPASRFLVHEGYESRLPPADTGEPGGDPVDPSKVTPRTPWTYDTLLATGAVLRDSVFSIRNPGPGSVRVIIRPSGDTAAEGVIGVQALFRFEPVDEMPPLAINLDAVAAGGRSIYQLVPGTDGWGTLADWGAAAGARALSEAGAYILAKDTSSPRLRILDEGIDREDSSWVSVLVEDNIRDVHIKCFPMGNKDVTSVSRREASGRPFRLAFLPVKDPAPLKITLSVDDGRQQTAFPPPPAAAYALARGLDALAGPVSGEAGLKWGLYGLPVRPREGMTLDGLSEAAGAGSLHGAVWIPDPQDSIRGAYRRLDGDDTLPAGAGFWMAAEKAFGSLPLGAVRSLAQGGSRGYSLRLRRGWNLITDPALESLPWVVSKSDLEAYDRSPVKGLHAYREGGYVDADTLEPWKGYFVFSRMDTTLELAPEGPVLAKSALRKPAAGAWAAGAWGGGAMAEGASDGGGRSAPIQVFLEPVRGPDGILPAPAVLRLGAAAYASDGLADEDEHMPASPLRDIGLAASRARRSLRTDLVGYRPGGTHAWKLAWSGRGSDRPSGGLLRVARIDLPEGTELRAATFHGVPASLVREGDLVALSGEASDTLVIWAAPKGSWQEGDPVPGLSPRPALLSLSFRDGPDGGWLQAALPEATALRTTVHAADGRRLSRTDWDRLAPGQHRLPLAPGGLRAKGLLLVTVEFPGGDARARAVLKIIRP